MVDGFRSKRDRKKIPRGGEHRKFPFNPIRGENKYTRVGEGETTTANDAGACCLFTAVFRRRP